MALALKKKGEQAFYDALIEFMTSDCKNNEFYEYKKKVIECMKEMGASNNEVSLVKDETILNGINNKWKPENVAWAILQ